MKEYHKIQSVFKRDPHTHLLISGDWTLPEFEFLADNKWDFTEKVDGTNIRVIWNDGKISFGGRTDRALIPATLFSKLRDYFGEGEGIDRVFGCGEVCLYGEGYGDNIQKGGKYLQNRGGESDFVLFDVKVGEWWLHRADVEDVALRLGIDFVPIVDVGTLHDAINRVKGQLWSAWGDFPAEGIVARPSIELKTRGGDRIITKIKCRDFK